MGATGVRTFPAGRFSAEPLLAAKGAQCISVCLPARNEAATVGAIVATVRRHLVDAVGLVDEVVVVDDHSTDGTARVAADAGARVVDAATVLPSHGSGFGKGEALWKSIHEATGDLIVWCDADVREFSADFVVDLLGPLLTDPTVDFVKGFYDRPASGVTGGGRVTELTARPLLSLYFPELAWVVQPLAGEYAGRRSILQRLPFAAGYGVDVALLIDVARARGVEAVAQVDLGVRHHRNRTLEDLGPQALAVAQAILRRAGVTTPDEATLVRPGRPPVTVTVAERPPPIELDSFAPSG